MSERARRTALTRREQEVLALVCRALNDSEIAEHPELKAVSIGMAPMERFAEADEVAWAIVWLCSNEASFITGHALLVDGGYVAR